MLSNDTVLQTSLVIASIIVAIVTIVTDLPTRRHIRSDMNILNSGVFIPFATLSLATLYLCSFLALVNSVLESESLSFIQTLILADCVVLFLPITSYYCFLLLRMAQPR